MSYASRQRSPASAFKISYLARTSSKKFFKISETRKRQKLEEHIRRFPKVIAEYALSLAPSILQQNFHQIYDHQHGSLLHICVHKCRKSHFMHNYRKSLFMDQPHYIILTHNNTLCYMPQSAISLCRPQRINNGEIEKYFSKFEGTHYVPNRGLSRKYPYDDAVIRKMLAKQ